MATPLLISGFRRTGKDTLHYDIKNGTLKFHRLSLNPFTWVAFVYHAFFSSIHYYVFGKSMSSTFTYVFETQNRDKSAFARPLKDDVHKNLGISHLSDSEAELLKDKIFPLNEKENGKYMNGGSKPNDGRKKERKMTLRDHYIKHAKAMRKIDDNYWVKRACTPNRMLKCDVMDFTDHRFTNESMYYENVYGRIVTCRLFRSSVPIPDKSVASEHSLDDFETNFLIVPDFYDYIFSCKIFPHHKKYFPCGYFTI